MISTAPRAQRAPLPFQTVGEEIANAILHGIGALLSVAGLVLLAVRARGYLGANTGGPLALASYLIYTIAMLCTFLTSTVYHALRHEGAKRVFRVLDHSAIYLLIAGTYTPFCLLHLRGGWGWALFGIEWALAAGGISLYALNRRFYKKAELAVYLLMGWAIVAGWSRLVKALSLPSLLLLLAGGLAYTLGTLWYRRGSRRGTHVVWHVFVLAGALFQWCSIWAASGPPSGPPSGLY